MKKSIQHLTLIFVFSLMCLYANAQYFKPVWVNDIGGSGDSKAANIAADSTGDIYISGYIRGTVTFNLKEGGSKQLTSNGDADIYIAKYNIATGNYIWAISVGGTDLEQPNSMAVDNLGNVLITGQFSSTVNFNPKGTFNLTPNGTDDIFIAKYTSNGDFLWAISMGGPSTDRGHYITTDNQNNVIITASYTGAVDVDPSAAVHLLPDQNSLACFFAKYDANGNFVWAHPLGVVNQQNLTAVTVDKTTNDVIITGDFSGNVDFSYKGTPGAAFNSPGISNFVARYANDGTYKWVKYLPGSGSGILSSLKIDNQSNIIITGNFGGQFYPNGPSGSSITAKGTNDVLVASYKSDGTLNWAENFGSNSSDATSRYVTVDGKNNIYITGWFTGSVSIDPALSNGVLTNNTGGRSALIAAFASSGKALAAGAIGSSCTSNLGYEIAAVNGNVYVAGSFCQTVNFDTGSCQTDNFTSINNTSDSFLASFLIANGLSGSITAFTIPQQLYPAIIDQTKNTIAVVVAPGSNVKALIPTITVSNGGTVSPASGVAHDFTLPVVYTVTSSCSSLQYSVNVYIAQTDSTCSGAANTIPGDIANPVPSAYAWQLFQNNVWVSAPGVVNNKDYQTSALTNNTNVNVIFSLRRQITAGGNVTFDSYYQVTVQPAAAITNNAITQPAVTSFCGSGNPGAIVGSTPAGGNGTYAYQWQKSADNVAFANIVGATAKDFTPSLTIATTYFRRTITSGTCTAPLTSNVVTITVTPVITNNTVTAPAVTSFCSSGDPGNITGSVPSGGTGGYTYEWQSSTDTVTFTDIAGGAAKDYNPPLTNVTSLYRRIVKSGTCIAISDTVTIVILSPPATPVPVAATIAICTGNSATLSVSSPQSGITYNWYDSASKTNHLFTGATYVTSPLITNQTFYVDATNGTCVSGGLASVQVNVNSLPAAPQVVTNQVAVCDGSVTTLSILNPQTGFTYNWYAAPTGGTAVFTGTDFVTPAITANISYYAEAVNSTGCVSLTRATVGITANPLPQIQVQGTSICPGTSATLTAGSTDQNASINWYAGATGGSILFTGGTFTTPVLNAAASYYAEAVDNTTGCTSPARGVAQVQLLQALPAPVVTIDSANTTSVTFQWSAINGAIAYQVSVDNGQTFVDPSSGSNGLTHTVTGLQLGNSVILIVRAIGNSSCQASDNSIPVTGTTISPLGNLIFVPNAFTPNGDGKNDIVYVHSESIRSLKFYVYDQWGELLYASTSQQNGWDGTYKGTKEPVGVYVYYLQAMMNDGHQVTKKGTITLLR